mmetsp:Transcript_35313/g.81795  ORF Transcript_35313/g.81795 Transcript_35313/m.81795 type:complete len:203 (+) Transcript_35313:866-1474(+)
MYLFNKSRVAFYPFPLFLRSGLEQEFQNYSKVYATDFCESTKAIESIRIYDDKKQARKDILHAETQDCLFPFSFSPQYQRLTNHRQPQISRVNDNAKNTRSFKIPGFFIAIRPTSSAQLAVLELKLKLSRLALHTMSRCCPSFSSSPPTQQICTNLGSIFLCRNYRYVMFQRRHGCGNLSVKSCLALEGSTKKIIRRIRLVS